MSVLVASASNVRLPITTLPVPLGATVIVPLAASAIVILPEFVPAFVFSIKSPVPLVVIVALALLSPTRTVSASNCTSPVPFGVNAMLPLVSVDVIELPSIVMLSITAD